MSRFLKFDDKYIKPLLIYKFERKRMKKEDKMIDRVISDANYIESE